MSEDTVDRHATKPLSQNAPEITSGRGQERTTVPLGPLPPSDLDQKKGQIDGESAELKRVRRELEKHAQTRPPTKDESLAFPELSSPWVQKIMAEFDEQKIPRLVQLLVAVATYDDQGQPLSDAAARMQYATRLAGQKSFAIKQEGGDQETTSSPVRFAYTQLEEMLRARNLDPNAMNLCREFIMARYGLSAQEVARVASEFTFHDIDRFGEREAAFVKSPLFSSDKVPKPSRWQYDVLRHVSLPMEHGLQSFMVRVSDGNELELSMEGSAWNFRVPKGLVEQYAQNKPTWAEKMHTLEEAIVKVGDRIQDAALIVSQLGGIHPGMVEGKLAWVLEPWAKVEMNEEELGYAKYGGTENKYYYPFMLLKKAGVRVISNESIQALQRAGFSSVATDGAPLVTPRGMGIMLIEHHRIMAAQEVGLPIVVHLTRQIASMR